MDTTDQAATNHTRLPMPGLRGGALCLDFANTVDPRYGGTPHEYLSSYAALVAWSRHTNLLTEAGGQDLIGTAQRRPRDADAVLHQAIILREAIYHVFSAIAHSEHPAPGDLAAVNAAFPRPGVVERATGFGWGWADDPNALDQMLWSVAWSAAELLVQGELSQVKECGAGCGWLFLDRSKNSSRRYCNPDVCGNRVRARRHYARKRSTAGGTTGASSG